MSDLTDFLLARVAEDEAVAREAQALAGTPWRATHGRQVEEVRDGYLVTPEDEHSDSDEPSDSVALHIARHDPARVLAECEAKRRIAGMYVGPTEDDEGNLSAIGGYGEAWLDAIRFLALPYADHPDYNPDWRP